MHDHPHHDNELDEMTARVRALETILVEKGLLDPEAVDAIIGSAVTETLQELLRGIGDVERILSRVALRSARPRVPAAR